MKNVQTKLTDSQLEALARVETALNVPPGKGRPGDTPAKNIKLSLALCVQIADWLLSTGVQPPAHVLTSHDNGSGQ